MTASVLQLRWWEKAAAITRIYAKDAGMTLKDITQQLDDLCQIGFDALEIFAPFKGGHVYSGLDTLDFYQIDPALGTMDDFKALIAEAHQRGIAVVIFINLGYSHEQFPPFLKACQDIRDGIDSAERRWFVWSDTGQDVMDKSLAPHFLNDSHGNWRWNETAQKYFWFKWEGEKGGYHLPQFNFGDAGWQEEVRRILDFWLCTGIDGVIIDAVNWYVDCNWEITRYSMTDVVQAYDNQFIQPEGAGGFQDDPVPWISSGGFNCVMDYSIKLWWEGKDLIRDAICSGNPRPIESALRVYRDRVVALGGVCYINTPSLSDAPIEAQILGAAVVATVGELLLESENEYSRWLPEYQAGIKHLLALRHQYPALCASGERITLKTSNDDQYYAFIRKLRGEASLLVLLNFQPEERQIEVEINACTLTNVINGQVKTVQQHFILTLPPYGYSIWIYTQEEAS